MPTWIVSSNVYLSLDTRDLMWSAVAFSVAAVVVCVSVVVAVTATWKAGRS